MKVKKFTQKKVSLRNQGDLSVFFIGTGSAFAKTLFQTNLLIVKGEDHFIIDCGTKFSAGLASIGLNVLDINNYLITHSHADHVGGLEEVMMLNRYVVNKKPNMIITPKYQKLLWNESLTGGAKYSEKHNGKFLKFTDFWSPLKPEKMKKMPRETYQFNLGSLNIKMPRTCHIPDSAKSWKDATWSTGVLLDDKVLFTSDTMYDPELLIEFDKLYDLEVIFHDCQFFTGGVHSSIDELAALPIEIKRKTILTHYSDNWKDNSSLIKKLGFHSFAKQQQYYTF